MRVLRILWVLSITLFMSVARAEEAPGVAVLYFNYDGKNSDLEILKKGLTQMLISHLQPAASNVKLVERERLEDIYKELELSTTAKIDPKTAVKMGKLIGAEYIVVGSYFDLFGSLRIDSRVVHVETGEIIASAGANGSMQDFFQIEAQIIEGLTPELRKLGSQTAVPKAESKTKKAKAVSPKKQEEAVVRKRVAPKKEEKTEAKVEAKAEAKVEKSKATAAMYLPEKSVGISGENGASEEGVEATEASGGVAAMYLPEKSIGVSGEENSAEQGVEIQEEAGGFAAMYLPEKSIGVATIVTYSKALDAKDQKKPEEVKDIIKEISPEDAVILDLDSLLQ